jgi:2-dehydro-3-deoxyphosphogluconate aldolase/(4S)-4-hydroxy-2-oxoglutarate aldolase
VAKLVVLIAFSLPASLHPVDVLDVMHTDRVIAVLRASRVPDAIALGDAFAEGGVRCVEFTFTIPNVVSLIRTATSSRAYIGAGTVLHPEQAQSAIDAGASFIVSPAMRPDIVGVCRDAGVPVFLGALTPTEVAAAVDAGATAIKIFPAGLGGPRYIRDLRGPYPEISFIPSGGVSEDNAREFLDAGCPAVYAGSRLAPAEIIESGHVSEVTRRARAFVASLD